MTEVRLAAEAIASVQSQLDQTTLDIQAAIKEMEEEELDILGVAGTVAGLAAAVVAVVAAVPSAGASLVALAPSMVALSSAVIDNAEPIAKALMAGDEAETDGDQEGLRQSRQEGSRRGQGREGHRRLRQGRAEADRGHHARQQQAHGPRAPRRGTDARAVARAPPHHPRRSSDSRQQVPGSTALRPRWPESTP